MPKFGPNFKNIDKKVKDRIKKLNIVPKFVFDSRKSHERFYTVPCYVKNNKRKKVVFKMRIENYYETRNFFRKEIKINKLFTRCYNKEKNLFVPKYIDGNCKQSPEWMIYDYIEGKTAGDYYNGFYKETLSKFPIKNFIKGVKTTHTMSSLINNKNLINLEKKGYIYYRKEYDIYKDRLKPFFSKKEIDKAKDIFISYKHLLDKKCAIVTHGDLHPGNIIITHNNQIAIIDWFYVHLNNMAFDIAFLYMEMWQNKKVRNKILNDFAKVFSKNEPEFSELFRLSVLRIAPQKINVLYDSIKNKQDNKPSYYKNLSKNGIKKLECLLKNFETALYGINFFDNN